MAADPGPEAAPGDDGTFGRRLLAWFDRHGRHGLPWQREPDPYRIWVSEIMLQQTRVETVAGYFERFVARFPDVAALGRAKLDAVLHLWSGLGYYARARNLHRAAGIVVREHGGTMPRTLAGLVALPGIGRSTAGAILALAHGERHPILDGNVKRVLSRYHGVEGWPGKSAVERRLWALAASHTPRARVRDYTQAIMDLGATLCARGRPRCPECPVADGCRARAEGRQAALPTRRRTGPVPVRRTRFIVARDPGGRVFLERRDEQGIWGGLWSFPECPPEGDVAEWCVRRLGRAPAAVTPLPAGRHAFTHFRLEYEPVLAEVSAPAPGVMEAGRAVWYKNGSPAGLGLAAPIRVLLDGLGDLSSGEG